MAQISTDVWIDDAKESTSKNGHELPHQFFKNVIINHSSNHINCIVSRKHSIRQDRQQPKRFLLTHIDKKYGNYNIHRLTVSNLWFMKRISI